MTYFEKCWKELGVYVSVDALEWLGVVCGTGPFMANVNGAFTVESRLYWRLSWEEQTRTALTIWPTIVSSNRPPKTNRRHKIAGFFKGNLHSLLHLLLAPTPLLIEMDPPSSDNPSKWVAIIAKSPFTYAKLPQQPMLLYYKWEWSPSPFTDNYAQSY